ncbi:type II secretion system protein GspM [Paenibacillus sp. PsM32]|uniref:type II secretion system protein GspM n=1 Tax=unclassified Paenibacillus TaxID=185978 RepID=UPI0023663BA5|nr:MULTISPECIES: type II secretion system protein GspM [unclassified Paenibacillus]MDN4617460.1 type II secretion system protein GspM [Paenibacillus sp. PsM32]MDQ1232693.1 type IV pilus assembly protein PilO [Paenibacillus sp. SORGH_AS_0306]MDR6109743.1 type IV pilus assembly protein PilO [Paenibacillus sp. SORGH_AS_0338]WDF50174.1 type II secretion system protein GspM [Paenibacillus sp. KACC 21273]
MEQLNKYRNVILLGIILLFVILLAFYMWVLYPLSQKSEQYDVQLNQMQQEYNLIQTKIAQLKGSQPTDAQQAIQAAIPATVASEKLLIQLQQVDQTSYARITDIEFVNVDNNNSGDITAENLGVNVGQIRMNAELEGGYTEIREWMNQLQKLPRLITVDSFSFQQPYTPGKSGPILTANVSFTAYYNSP